MADFNKTALLTVKIDEDEAINDIVNLRKSIEQLTAAQEKQETTTEEGLRTFEKNKQAIKILNSEIRVLEKTVKDNAAATAKQDGSYKSLVAQLSKVSNEWKKLSEAERENTEKGKLLSAQKLDLTNKLKALDGQTGVNSRNVGNYTNSIIGLENELRDLKAILTTQDLGSQEFIETKKAIDDVSFSLQVATGKIDELGNREAKNKLREGFNDAQQSAQALTQTLTLLSVAFKDNENAGAAINKVIQGLAVAQTALVIIQAKKSIQDTADLALTRLRTVAQLALNNATKAFGIGAVIAGVTTLVALISKWRNNLSSLSEEQKLANIEIQDEKIKLEALVGVAKDTNNNLTQRKAAVEELNKLSPEYLGNLTLETINTNDATTAIKNYLQALKDKALAEALYAKVVEKTKELIELQDKTSNGISVFDLITQGITGKVGGNFSSKLNDIEKLKAEIDDLSLRYRDALGNFIVSDPEKAKASIKDVVETARQEVTSFIELQKTLGVSNATASEVNALLKVLGFDFKVEDMPAALEQYKEGILKPMSTANDEYYEGIKTDAKESTDTQKEELERFRNIAVAFAQDLGNIFADSLTKTGLDLTKFFVGVTTLILDDIQKTLLVTQFKILAGDLSKLGFAGIATAAAKIALITASFEAAKALLQQQVTPEFYEGGQYDPNKGIDLKGNPSVKDGTVWTSNYGQQIKTHAGEKMFITNSLASEHIRKAGGINEMFGGKGLNDLPSYKLYDGGFASSSQQDVAAIVRMVLREANIVVQPVEVIKSYERTVKAQGVGAI